MLATAAQSLLEARLSGKPIAGLNPQVEPKTIEEAYRIQEELVAAIAPTAGWKIMGIAGDNRMASPLPQSFLHETGATITPTGLPIVIVEVEVAVRFGRDLPARSVPYGSADIESAIASLHPAIELISLSWLEKDKVPQLAQLADFQNSTGLVLGDAVTDWRQIDTASVVSTLQIDGDQAGRSDTGPTLVQIIDALAWLANHAAARGMPLLAGHVVTTGARILKPISGNRKVGGEVTELGRVEAMLNS